MDPNQPKKNEITPTVLKVILAPPTGDTTTTTTNPGATNQQFRGVNQDERRVPQMNQPPRHPMLSHILQQTAASEPMVHSRVRPEVPTELQRLLENSPNTPPVGFLQPTLPPKKRRNIQPLMRLNIQQVMPQFLQPALEIEAPVEIRIPYLTNTERVLALIDRELMRRAIERAERVPMPVLERERPLDQEQYANNAEEEEEEEELKMY